jgi:YD repeat-containing protein
MYKVMNRYLLILSGTFLLVQSLLAQRKAEPQNIATPNAAGFAAYGNVPVNLFTGSPDLSIPLFEVKNSDISVPIVLNYQPSAVQVNSHPGWTGLGMSLICGGVITRIQKGGEDELKDMSGTEYGFFYHYNNLNVDDWYSPAQLRVFADHQHLDPDAQADAMPDEFVFNFLGYTGKFILGHDGEWKVVCEDKIEVALIDYDTDDIITAGNLRSQIKDLMPAAMKEKSYYYLNKFRLKTPDGTLYEFGGVDATEYSVSYRRQIVERVIPTSWYLTKITTQKGDILNFGYTVGDPTCALAQQYALSRYEQSAGGGWFDLGYQCSGTSISLTRRPANGYLLFPVYLDSIESAYSTIKFIKSESVELKYDETDLNAPNPLNPYPDFQYIVDPLTELKWYQLDQITILDDDNNLLKSYDLKYTNSFNTRLKLLSVTEVDKDGLKNSPWSFKYNSTPLPEHYGSDQIDHWGYYNGKELAPWSINEPIEPWINAYPASREPDETGQFVRAELLERITYPTGGYDIFEFEPHDFSKQVSDDRASLVSHAVDKFAGGGRIKKITSYERDDSQLLSKEFYYVLGYSGQPDETTLPSSGILGGGYKYYWPGYQGKDYGGNVFSYDLFSSNSLLPSSVNAEGSHIGYTEVVERVSGNGYSKTYFTNFGFDIFDPDPLDDDLFHMDEPALGYIDAERSVYSPYTSKSIERGRPQKIETFDENNRRIQVTQFTYAASSSEFIRAVDLQLLDICSANATARALFGTSFKYYNYNYNKVSEETTTFDSNGPGSITTKTEFEFNGNNLLKSEKMRNSAGQEIKKEILYADEITDGVLSTKPERKAIQTMVTNHIIDVPIEVTEYYGGNVVRSFVSKFQDQSGVIVPFQDFKTELWEPVDDYRKIYSSEAGIDSELILDGRCQLASEYKFHDSGKIKQIQSEDGITTTYVWGYKDLFPVAQIVNATYDQVLTSLEQSTLDELNDAPGTDSEMRQTFQALRDDPAFEKAKVTSYTYDPNKGMTSSTDANGKITYYEYDTFGRLRLVRDNNQNILKRYEYHYQLR